MVSQGDCDAREGAGWSESEIEMMEMVEIMRSNTEPRRCPEITRRNLPSPARCSSLICT